MMLQVVNKLEGHEGFSPMLHGGSDGLLYSVGRDLRIWDKSGKQLKVLNLASACGSFAAPNSSFIVACEGMNSSVEIFNKFNYSKMIKFNMNGYIPNAMVVTETHACVAPGSAIYVYDLGTLQEAKKLSFSTGVGALTVQGNKLYASLDDTIHVYDLGSFEETQKFKCGVSEVKQLAIVDDILYAGGRALITASDLKTSKKVHEFQGHSSDVNVITTFGKTLFSSSDSTLKIWDLNNHGLLNSLQHPGGVVTATIWNDQLVTADNSDIGIIKIWGTQA